MFNIKQVQSWVAIGAFPAAIAAEADGSGSHLVKTTAGCAVVVYDRGGRGGDYRPIRVEVYTKPALQRPVRIG